MAGNRQLAFLFSEAGDKVSIEQLGGKAMSLATMTKLGLPVPPGFAVPTGACRAYLEHARHPRRLEWHIARCLKALESQTGKKFGDTSNPLLVSVRSGAPVSMPGMMDTILNLGFSEKMFHELVSRYGLKFAGDTLKRFWGSFRKVVGSKSDDPREQLQLALEAVSMSWLNDRAIEYRRVHGIPENMGTAVIVQAMVFGNMDENSGTGVYFSRNVATGEKEPYGEYLPQSQGEDVVGGSVTPLPITKLSEINPQAFKQLVEFGEILERHAKDVVEVEFTIESGKLWTLQYRVAKRTPIAAARLAVQAVWEKKISKTEAVARISEAEIVQLSRPIFDSAAIQQAIKEDLDIGHGLPASPGAATGIAVFTSGRAQELAKEGKQVILFRRETNPDDFAGMLVSAGFVTEVGGTTSHAAVVARGLGKPAVVGTVFEKLLPAAGSIVSIDGASGYIFSGELPLAASESVNAKEVSIFLKWLEQLKPVGRADFTAVERQYSANRMLHDFYLADEMALAARGTVIEAEAEALRTRVHRKTAEVFAAYLMLAVAGELRHGWNDYTDSWDSWRSKEFEILHDKFGLRRIQDGRDDRFDAQMSVVGNLRESDREAQKEFLRLAVQAFRTWDGGGFGGPKWAAIAEAALTYLSGELGNTVFVDRVFDLRHNGGLLFNKHSMFSERTAERQLQAELNIKKRTSSIEELVRKLGIGALATSDEVWALYEKGRGKYWNRGKQNAEVV